LNSKTELLEQHRARERGPAAGLLGHQVVSLDRETGTIRTRFQARPEFCNPMGVVQGGILMAMLDQALVDATMLATDMQYAVMTLEMESQFLNPAYPGELFCETKVRRAGRSTAFVEGTLSNGEGVELVTASVVAVLRKKQA
jgi:uncharacterized protein (TIGR00369 family)